METIETDGHWPFYDTVTCLIRCECGEAPKKMSARLSMAHVWHKSHRRRLGLQPVEYLWAGRTAGLSQGGLMRVRGHRWEPGTGWVKS
jgi:hypothetical protein